MGFETAPNYWDWFKFEFWRFVFVQQALGKELQTFLDFPPMQSGASFNLDALKAEMQEKMAEARAAAKGTNSTEPYDVAASRPDPEMLSELGRAVKTIFLARYLHSLALRREIHEGLNTIERWNGANDFVYFARRGEMTSNRREDQEISILSLHLLQNCMVYVNTLMLQEVLAQPHWQGRLTETDRLRR